MQVIKMPHSQKATEDKEKMAFMEYAISGILLHNNIVQTYQADIRPVFLDDDTETGTVSRSGWTGLGEFLSNDAISQKMHKSMRIQEWELRLVMEYCNKGKFPLCAPALRSLHSAEIWLPVLPSRIGCSCMLLAWSCPVQHSQPPHLGDHASTQPCVAGR